MESTLQLLPVKTEQIESIDNLVSTGKPFIEANTVESTMDEIRNNTQLSLMITSLSFDTRFPHYTSVCDVSPSSNCILTVGFLSQRET